MRLYIRKVRVKKYKILVIRVGRVKFTINKLGSRIDVTFNYNNWDK